MKGFLPDDVLRYVLSVEASKPDGWLGFDEHATVIDNYQANLCRGKPFSLKIIQVSKKGRINQKNIPTDSVASNSSMEVKKKVFSADRSCLSRILAMRLYLRWI